MGVGALGLPLDLSNLVGGVMVLLLAAFGRFLLNGTRIPFGERAGVLSVVLYDVFDEPVITVLLTRDTASAVDGARRC